MPLGLSIHSLNLNNDLVRLYSSHSASLFVPTLQVFGFVSDWFIYGASALNVFEGSCLGTHWGYQGI